MSWSWWWPLAFLAAVFRAPRRRDLIYLSGGLVAGILAQAVIGGIVVLTKLNPYWVMLHLVATLVLVANAVVLVHRSTRDYSPGSGRALVPRPLLQFQYGILTLLGIVITAGTAATGAGPLAGNSQGQEVAKRIPLAFRDLAELHAVLAMLLVGMTVGLVVGLHMTDVPERVRRAGQDIPRGHGGPGRRRLHAVLHPPPRPVGRGAHPRGHRPGRGSRPVFPGLHLPPPGAGDRPGGGPSGRDRRADRRQVGLPASSGRQVGCRTVALPANRPPSSSGLGHRPFTAAARVRIPLGVPTRMSLIPFGVPR